MQDVGDETQLARVARQIREMIFSGELTPGERLREIPLAEALGVSRTPVRLAFGQLEQENLITREPHKGFTVRRFSAEEVADAMDVRGALEGMACRLVAERGLSRDSRRALEQCLDEAETLFGKGHLVEDDSLAWNRINSRFHDTLIAAARNAPLGAALKFNNAGPLVAANKVPFYLTDMDSLFRILRASHEEHVVLLTAIINGEGARAEWLMREHLRGGRNKIVAALTDISADSKERANLSRLVLPAA